MKKVAVGFVHGHTPKWLQTFLYSLKNTYSSIPFDIFIANSDPGHPSIKAILGNGLADNVTIVDCTNRRHCHGTGLDNILGLLDPNEYEYFFTTETDCKVMQPDWLNWFYKFAKDNTKMGAAGFYWSEGDHHNNINPSATLYRVDMLKHYTKEVLGNKDNTFYHWQENKPENHPDVNKFIETIHGAFSEHRGIKNPTPVQDKYLREGVPFTGWFEPGQWLYCRMQGEWEETRVPCDHVYMKVAHHDVPEGTYYGGKANPQFIHYWGGTRAYDFLRGPMVDKFVQTCTNFWLEREDRIWKETVPEPYRQIVYDIEAEMNVEELKQKNLFGG